MPPPPPRYLACVAAPCYNTSAAPHRALVLVPALSRAHRTGAAVFRPLPAATAAGALTRSPSGPRQAVTEDAPVKSFAMDLPEDSAVTFSFMREHGGATHGHDETFATHAPDTTGTLPPAPGVEHTPPVLPGWLPPAPVEPPPPVPLPPTPLSSGPVSSARDEDDALARRLERLKRGD